MRKIAHRGNIAGVNSTAENTLEYLQHAYQHYDVEVDVIGHRGILYFGHDEPQEPADTNFIQRPGVWTHAKNTHALELLTQTNANYFWHQEDDYTITRSGHIWCYPGNHLRTKNAIWLTFDSEPVPDTTGIFGICKDSFEKDT